MIVNKASINFEIRIDNILRSYGIYIEKSDELFEIDSLQYLTMIIDIEDEFGIEVDEKYFVEEKLDSIDSIKRIIERVR